MIKPVNLMFPLFTLVNIALYPAMADNKSDYAGKVLMSTSKLCHSHQSKYFNSIIPIKGKDDDGNEVITNLYSNLDDCLLAGGKLTKQDQAALAAESTDILLEKVELENQGKQEEEAQQKFYGINWGLGLAFTSLDVDVINDVTIDNTTVRVNKKFSKRAIAMLESHYFFSIGEKLGFGPYMAIGVAGDENVDPLKTYGGGLMFGARTDKKGGSWNIGVGYFRDTEVAQLRDGVADNSTTTETDPQKLLTYNDQGGWMIMFSATF